MILSVAVVLVTLAAPPGEAVTADDAAPTSTSAAASEPAAGVYPGYYPSAAIVIWEAPCYERRARHRWDLEGHPVFPAVHYRRPYNYRNLIDLPWHADQHRDVWQGVPVLAAPVPPPGPAPLEGISGEGGDPLGGGYELRASRRASLPPQARRLQ